MKIGKKSITLFLYLITSIISTAQENFQIIENPDYDLANTKRFKISKIELNSAETRIHLQWDIPEGWWVIYGDDTFIRNPETDEKLTIVSMVDEEFNTKMTIDSTGTHHSIFIFPPLEKGIKKIDYNGQFFGLYLNEKKLKKTLETPKKIEQWLDAELAKNKNAPIKNYEDDAFFSKKPAKIIGYIKGYDTRLKFDTGIYYASNELTREDYPVIIEIDEDGKFQAEIPLIHPVRSYLYVSNRIIPFYLEPGQTLGMVLDWENFLDAEHYNHRFYPQNAIEFRGNLAQINQELSQFQFAEFNYEKFKENSLNLSADDFKVYVFNLETENDKKLDSFLFSHPTSSNAELILRNQNKLASATMIMNYLMNRNYYLRENPENEFLKENIQTSYYSFLQKLPLDSNALLINRQFSEFINRFEYANPLNFRPKPNRFIPKVSELEYFDENKIELTENERKLLNKPVFSSQEEFDQFVKDRSKFGEKYGELIKKYTDTYITPFIKNFDNSVDYMYPWRKKDSVMLNHLKLKNGLVYDITKTRSLSFDLEIISDADKGYKYWNELSATIEDDFLKAEGERIIQNKFPRMEKSPDGIITSVAIKSEKINLPDGKAKDQFYTIANKYKGKIVFVDFWATTCGPCVGSIKRMKEIREKYKDNPDFEFVFITDESQSPENNYKNFVNDQDLINTYRVSTDNYNRFRQLFKFNGIPKYVVLDKEGSVIDDDFQMHNFSFELPKILEKYK